MANPFNRKIDFGGSFNGEQATFTFAGTGTVGLVVQDFNTSYQQDLNRVYELGSKNMYYIAAKPIGDFTIGKIAGPKDTTISWLTKYGDVCQAAGNTLQVTLGNAWCAANAGTGTTRTTTLSSVVLSRIGWAVNARDLLVNEQLAGVFSTMDVV